MIAPGSSENGENAIFTVGTAILNSSGLRTLYVGASLNVPLTTPRGDYVGVFTIEVVY